MYVNVPVLKKLILVSVAWVISQYFYPSLDGMLDLHKGTPPPRLTLNLQVPIYLYTWVERDIVRVIKSVLAKNTTQWMHVADDLQELKIFSRVTGFTAFHMPAKLFELKNLPARQLNQVFRIFLTVGIFVQWN